MQSKATTVKAYLAELSPERRAALQAIRKVINANLPDGYEEGIQYGFISWYVPHSVYPWGYHCDPKIALPFAGLASQKNHIGVYLMCVYGNPEHEAWFRKEWAKTGKKLDMGKSCVRFKRVEDAALDVIGRTVKRVPAATFVANYEAALEGTAAGKKLARAKAKAAGAAPAEKAVKKSAAKKPARRAAKKAASKSPAKRKPAKRTRAKK